MCCQPKKVSQRSDDSPAAATDDRRKTDKNRNSPRPEPPSLNQTHQSDGTTPAPTKHVPAFHQSFPVPAAAPSVGARSQHTSAMARQASLGEKSNINEAASAPQRQPSVDVNSKEQVGQRRQSPRDVPDKQRLASNNRSSERDSPATKAAQQPQSSIQQSVARDSNQYHDNRLSDHQHSINHGGVTDDNSSIRPSRASYDDMNTVTSHRIAQQQQSPPQAPEMAPHEHGGVMQQTVQTTNVSSHQQRDAQRFDVIEQRRDVIEQRRDVMEQRRDVIEQRHDAPVSRYAYQSHKSSSATPVKPPQRPQPPPRQASHDVMRSARGQHVSEKEPEPSRRESGFTNL